MYAFNKELNNPDTNYFLIVSGDHPDDIDFVQYSWRRSKYNLVREGDLLMYRKKSNNKLLKEFFFYGAAKFETIKGDDRVISKLSKSIRFSDFVTQSELENYDWKWKKRGNNWANFFNQCGMDKIPREDFINLFRLGVRKINADLKVDDNTDDYIKSIEERDYFVEDKVGQSKQRTKQQIFSNTVKAMYSNKCTVCGISTRQFLVGSHIIPWSRNKETRMDPRNGLCLCSFHDKAFYEGFFTINEDFKIKVSINIQDLILANELSKIKNLKIVFPKIHKPLVKYLEYHNEYIFNKWKIQSL
jgi:putative restriction endonuclease